MPQTRTCTLTSSRPGGVGTDQVPTLATAAPVFVGPHRAMMVPRGAGVRRQRAPQPENPTNISLSRQKSLHMGISGTTARKGEEYFLIRAKGPVNQWFIRLRVAAPDERRGDRGVHSWAIRLRCALPDNPGVDSAKVPANHTPCWQGLSPVTPTFGALRSGWRLQQLDPSTWRATMSVPTARSFWFACLCLLASAILLRRAPPEHSRRGGVWDGGSCVRTGRPQPSSRGFGRASESPVHRRPEHRHRDCGSAREASISFRSLPRTGATQCQRHPGVGCASGRSGAAGDQIRAHRLCGMVVGGARTGPGPGTPREICTRLLAMTGGLVGKRLEFLPGDRSHAQAGRSPLASSDSGNHVQMQGAEAAAQVLGVQRRRVQCRSPDDLNAYKAAQGTDGCFQLADSLFLAHRTACRRMAARPTATIYGYQIDARGLMSYSPSFADLYQPYQPAMWINPEGRQACNLPVDDPMKFELVINLKTAKALGLHADTPGAAVPGDRGHPNGRTGARRIRLT